MGREARTREARREACAHVGVDVAVRPAPNERDRWTVEVGALCRMCRSRFGFTMSGERVPGETLTYDRLVVTAEREWAVLTREQRNTHRTQPPLTERAEVST